MLFLYLIKYDFYCEDHNSKTYGEIMKTKVKQDTLEFIAENLFVLSKRKLKL